MGPLYTEETSFSIPDIISDPPSQEELPSDQIPVPLPPLHIRFYESFVLDLHGRFGLTRAGVEYMLKSIDWSLGETGVVEPRSKNVPECKYDLL